MAAWGVIPSLSYITSITACPTCYNLDIARRPPYEFLPSLPGFNGSFWTFIVSLKNVSSAEEAGCQFCQVLSKVFRYILKGVADSFDSVRGTVSIAVPFNPSGDEVFHATFRYVDTRTEAALAQEISRRLYLTTIKKRTATI